MVISGWSSKSHIRVEEKKLFYLIFNLKILMLNEMFNAVLDTYACVSCLN